VRCERRRTELEIIHKVPLDTTNSCLTQTQKCDPSLLALNSIKKIRKKIVILSGTLGVSFQNLSPLHELVCHTVIF
jgi:hypothetical protein